MHGNESHYASDVIAGFCLCLVWLAISFVVLNKLDKGSFKF